MFARARSATVLGVGAVPVDVEVDLGLGLQSFHIAGLPDGAVREARIRVKSAIENIGVQWPMRRVSLNLSPADLRKDGPHFDLPIAIGVLAASEHLPKKAVQQLERVALFGELALDATLRPVRGVLPLAISARDTGAEAVVVARENAAEAAVVQGLDVYACADLGEALEALRGKVAPYMPARAAPKETRYAPDMRDVRGQAHALRAIEVAAAGAHNVLLVGPPGAGKGVSLGQPRTIVLPMSPNDDARANRSSLKPLSRSRSPLNISLHLCTSHRTEPTAVSVRIRTMAEAELSRSRSPRPIRRRIRAQLQTRADGPMVPRVWPPSHTPQPLRSRHLLDIAPPILPLPKTPPAHLGNEPRTNECHQTERKIGMNEEQGNKKHCREAQPKRERTS